MASTLPMLPSPFCFLFCLLFFFNAFSCVRNKSYLEPHTFIPKFMQVLLFEGKTKHLKDLKGEESQLKKQDHSRGRVNSCSILPRTFHKGWRPTASDVTQSQVRTKPDCPAKGHQWFYLEQLLQKIEVGVRRAEGSGERRVEAACQGKWVMLTLRQAACEGKTSLSYRSGGGGPRMQRGGWG